MRGEVEEAEEEDVELFKSGEDAPEAFEPAEEPLDLRIRIHSYHPGDLAATRSERPFFL